MRSFRSWSERARRSAALAALAGLVPSGCAEPSASAPPPVLVGTVESERMDFPVVDTPNGTVVAGTVDRLLVDDARILLVDFKTGRRVPADASAIPDHHLRQMAAYAAALAVIFPDRPIEAALLYTSGPTLFPLSPSQLLAHKPGFGGAEQMLAPDG